ncbi:MAG: HAMP domain-containing histidine kinase [Candidatus Eisenbacteria bacterium]|nr:HAMP domain-containing histidine kinase [Candidatus Eisenbacteria bacterium]
MKQPTPRERKAPQKPDPTREHLEKLAQRETTYWVFSSLLLVFLATTVIIQFLTAGDWLPDTFFLNEQYRRTLSVGLPGLVIVFCLYITAKRREISRLKITLYDQKTLLDRLEERRRELERALAELRRVSTLKDNLLSTVSHELKNPLASIHSVAQILMNYSDKDMESRDRFYQLIHTETKRLSNLVGNLLDLAKIESGRIVWDLSAEKPEEVVRSALAVSGVLAQEKKIGLREEIAPGLPELLVDRDRIIQVLTNLIGNAIKFTPEGGTITVSARSAADKGKKFVRFSIRDTGPGVSPDQRERIFEWFHQAPPPDGRKVEGTGLGLAISREIVHHFGGRIWVESKPRHGSEFIFTIPVPARVHAPARPEAVAGPK